MRILAIAQCLDQPAAESTVVRRHFAQLAREPVGDRRVIGRGARVGLGGEPAAERKRRHSAVPGELVEHQRVVARLDHDGNVGVILGGGADHGRAADIDILDAIVEARAARDGLLERIKVDHQQIDRVDVMGAHRFGMRGISPDGEEPAVHGRMQRLDAAVHHLRIAGQLGNVAHRESGIAKRFARATSRNEFDSVAGKSAGEFDNAVFVGDGEKGAYGAAEVFGHDELLSLIRPCVAQAKRGRGTMRSMVEGACSKEVCSSPAPLPPPSGGPLPRCAGQDEEGAGQLHHYSGSRGSSTRTRRPVPAVASAVALACWKLQTTRGMARACPWMTICTVRRRPSLPAR